MRITILANRDLHATLAVNYLWDALEGHEVSIFLSERVGRPRKGYVVPRELEQLQFLERDLLRLLDLTSGRFFTFDRLERQRGVPVRVAQNINKGEGDRAYAASQPDLVVSIRYGCILRDAAIGVPRHGVINLHSGLLPKYPGILTTLHSLVDGETEVGCTLHRIESKAIDAGAILGTASVPVDPKRSLLAHVLALYPPGCALIADAIRRLAAGESVETTPQDPADAGTYHGLPEPEDFERLRQAGFCVWDRDDILPVVEEFSS